MAATPKSATKTTAKERERLERLLPGGIPKWIRCYDKPSCGDRFTVVFTGNYNNIGANRFSDRSRDRHYYLGMSSDPFHPQGIGQHGESADLIDRPQYSHLGRRIQFSDLPEPCQRLVLRDYRELWQLPAA